MKEKELPRQERKFCLDTPFLDWFRSVALPLLQKANTSKSVRKKALKFAAAQSQIAQQTLSVA